MTLNNSKISEIYTTLFDVATEGLLLANKQGDIELVNPRLVDLFGYSEDELIGNKVEILIPREAKHKHIENRGKYAQSPSKRTMGIGRDLYGIHKEGKKIPVEISLNHFELDGDFYVMALVIDITERKASEAEILKTKAELEIKVKERTKELERNLEKLKRAEQNMQKAYEQEKELNELKSRFVSMASHEFKTPLANILTSATLIDKYKTEQQNEKRFKHVSKIKRSVNTLNAILNDFLSLDRVESGAINFNNVTFNIVELCNESIEQLNLLLKENQTIELICKQNVINVKQDKNAMTHIVANLLSNAIKYSNAGSVVTMFVETTDNELIIKVADQGIGIPEEEQKNIFGKFFRAKNSLNLQGTGLGLHIIKYYVELMNGKIKFESKEGVGTTFYITIPNIKE